MILIILVIGFLLFKKWQFDRSGYFLSSGNGFLRTLFDRGNYGEYLTYRCLTGMEGYNRILTNVYLPKDDGATTEIDLIMISLKGIFVFESKNYSGWIFGNEAGPMWTQTLKGGMKNKFYNPIWQNRGHIKALDSYLGGSYSRRFFSYIVFSERCTLKNINLRSRNVYVVKRNELYTELMSHQYIPCLTMEEVDNIYETLSKYANVEEEIKQRHKESLYR